MSTPLGASGDIVSVAYRPETFRSQAQDSEIANAVTFQRVDGVAQTARQEASIVRYGQRSYVRRDLLNAGGEDSTVRTLAVRTSLRRALATLRVDAVTVDTWARPLPQFLATVAIEPTDEAVIVSPLGDDPRPSVSGRVASIVHRVTPRVAGASMIWETDIRVDTREVVGVPGGQLPADVED